MRFSVTENPDASCGYKYEIARAIYAEGGGQSLKLAEALASVVANAAAATGRPPVDVVRDTALFPSRDKSSKRHGLWCVRADDTGFQMCLRVANKMLKGNLGECCNGATRFHHEEDMPDWAMNRGYVAEFGGLLFYA